MGEGVGVNHRNRDKNRAVRKNIGIDAEKDNPLP